MYFMTRIGSNSSNSLLNAIRKTSDDITRSIAKLSSGSKIITAKDDAAGLALLSRFEAEGKALRKANDNISYGQSAIQIADGAAGEITNTLGRMRELAAQSANGTLSDAQRAPLEAEFQQLGQEIDRIVGTTNFNGQQLLSSDSDFSIQAGTDGGPDSTLTVENANIASDLSSSGVSSLSIADVSSSQTALDALANAIGKVSQSRGSLGAFSSRLEAADNNNQSRFVGTQEAASRIGDVDVAEETARLVGNQIRNQAGVAMLAQANISSEVALRLLK